MFQVFAVFLTCSLLFAACAAAADVPAADDLAGWQGMRIVKQEGSPTRLFAADLAGNGRKQVVVVNTRMSRLDIYRWLAADERQDVGGGRCRASQ